MSEKEILRDYPELTSEDIRASLAYAAERENKPRTSWFTEKWAGKFMLPKPDPSDPRLQQATMLAYIDAFWLFALTSIAVVPFVFFIKKPPKGAPAVAH